ncbi:hypothetical protein OHA21_38280 [Actinoplanes sp. NBC_00393]|uniref:hypothetical protein n=1 Tax=Actinoplanes sp. NBC_00393 TaxID=2975953 RepID=UPI002E22981F
MLDNYDWPVPQAPTIDHVLRDLTEHAGYDVADDGELDQTFATHPHQILAWVSAAARYAATEFQLQMLHHPITWMRMELAPDSDQGTEDLDIFTDNMSRLLTEHGRLRAARTDAHRDFTHACPHLEAQQVLIPTGRTWQQIQLIADGLDEPMTVEVPTGAAAPWLLVKADLRLIDRLAALTEPAQPGRPVLRRSLAGIVRVDHDGTRRWVLPDPEHRYWLHDFAWSLPHGSNGEALPGEGCDR